MDQKQNEMDLSWSNQLDVVGMQPHSREYLEYEINCMRSARALDQIDGAYMEQIDGIQFSGKP